MCANDIDASSIEMGGGKKAVFHYRSDSMTLEFSLKNKENLPLKISSKDDEKKKIVNGKK